MPDWLTYTPESFLMFSERTYRRLFELHNTTLWPLHAVAAIAGIIIAILLFRGGRGSARTVSALLAAAWLAVACGWFEWRFSTIHTGGRMMAAAFALEAVALLWFGVVRHRVEPERPAGVAGWIAFAILVFGALMNPLLGRALGRPWTQTELFGLAPDPTVLATLGVLILAQRARWFLWIIPVGWCLFSGLTLWAMHTPDAWLPPAIAIAGVALVIARQRRQANHAPLSQEPNPKN
jgi:hypothetical protein